MSEKADATPDGDPIHVTTLWLDYPDGSEQAISIDTTRIDAALGRLADFAHRRRVSRSTENGDR